MRVKDSTYKFVIVCKRYYDKYKQNAFIERQAQANDYDEAIRIKASFENCDNEKYIILTIR